MDLDPMKATPLSTDFKELEELIDLSLREPFRKELERIGNNPRASTNSAGASWALDNEVSSHADQAEIKRLPKFLYHRQYPRLVFYT